MLRTGPVAETFTWNPSLDPGERKYALGRLPLPGVSKRRAKHYVRIAPAADPWAAWLAWAPTPQAARGKYWAAGDGTLHGMARQLRELGFIKSYHWTRDVDLLKRALYHIGPVIVGTAWYEGMNRPDLDGRVTVDGPRVGYHAWLIIGYDPGREAFRGLNSWGASWGQLGRFWIPQAAFAHLLKDGVGCVPVPLDKKP